MSQVCNYLSLCPLKWFIGKKTTSSSKESSSRSKRRDSRSKSPRGRRHRSKSRSFSPSNRGRQRDPRLRGRRSRSPNRGPRSPPRSRKSGSRERYRGNRRNWSPRKKGPVSPPPIQQVNHGFNMPPPQIYADGYNYPQAYAPPAQGYGTYDYSMQVQPAFNAYPNQAAMQPVPPGNFHVNQQLRTLLISKTFFFCNRRRLSTTQLGSSNSHGNSSAYVGYTTTHTTSAR